LVVSGKKRHFAAKLDIELNGWRMKQVEERYISLLTDFGFDRLFEEAEIAKFTPQEMREYETSKMAYRDIKNSVDTAKREGIAEGMEIGMAKGKQEGLAEGMEKGMNQKAEM
jgi:flagellar biosynthesis/type III secretory pathway protein FliH